MFVRALSSVRPIAFAQCHLSASKVLRELLPLSIAGLAIFVGRTERAPPSQMCSRDVDFDE